MPAGGVQWQAACDGAHYTTAPSNPVYFVVNGMGGGQRIKTGPVVVHLAGLNQEFEGRQERGWRFEG